MMNKLQSCSFSGKPVEVKMRTDGYYLWWLIEHTDEPRLCRVIMVSEPTETESGKEAWQSAKEKVIVAWNTRIGK